MQLSREQPSRHVNNNTTLEYRQAVLEPIRSAAAKAPTYSIYPSAAQDTYIYERSVSSKSDIYSNSDYDTASTTTFTPSSFYSPALSTDSTITLKSPPPADERPLRGNTPAPATSARSAFPLHIPALANAHSAIRGIIQNHTGQGGSSSRSSSNTSFIPIPQAPSSRPSDLPDASESENPSPTDESVEEVEQAGISSYTPPSSMTGDSRAFASRDTYYVSPPNRSIDSQSQPTAQRSRKESMSQNVPYDAIPMRPNPERDLYSASVQQRSPSEDVSNSVPRISPASSVSSSSGYGGQGPHFPPGVNIAGVGAHQTHTSEKSRSSEGSQLQSFLEGQIDRTVRESSGQPMPSYPEPQTASIPSYPPTRRDSVDAAGPSSIRRNIDTTYITHPTQTNTEYTSQPYNPQRRGSNSSTGSTSADGREPLGLVQPISNIESPVAPAYPTHSRDSIDQRSGQPDVHNHPSSQRVTLSPEGMPEQRLFNSNNRQPPAVVSTPIHDHYSTTSTFGPLTGTNLSVAVSASPSVPTHNPLPSQDSNSGRGRPDPQQISANPLEYTEISQRRQSASFFPSRPAEYSVAQPTSYSVMRDGFSAQDPSVTPAERYPSNVYNPPTVRDTSPSNGALAQKDIGDRSDYRRTRRDSTSVPASQRGKTSESLTRAVHAMSTTSHATIQDTLPQDTRQLGSSSNPTYITSSINARSSVRLPSGDNRDYYGDENRDISQQDARFSNPPPAPRDSSRTLQSVPSVPFPSDSHTVVSNLGQPQNDRQHSSSRPPPERQRTSSRSPEYGPNIGRDQRTTVSASRIQNSLPQQTPATSSTSGQPLDGNSSLTIEPRRTQLDPQVQDTSGFVTANQRRHSNGDRMDPSLRPTTPGGTRTVRWTENLICPSPIFIGQRRKGWFNRRGYAYSYP